MPSFADGSWNFGQNSFSRLSRFQQLFVPFHRTKKLGPRVARCDIIVDRSMKFSQGRLHQSSVRRTFQGSSLFNVWGSDRLCVADKSGGVV